MPKIHIAVKVGNYTCSSAESRREYLDILTENYCHMGSWDQIYNLSDTEKSQHGA